MRRRRGFKHGQGSKLRLGVVDYEPSPVGGHEGGTVSIQVVVDVFVHTDEVEGENYHLAVSKLDDCGFLSASDFHFVDSIDVLSHRDLTPYAGSRLYRGRAVGHDPPD